MNSQIHTAAVAHYCYATLSVPKLERSTGLLHILRSMETQPMLEDASYSEKAKSRIDWEARGHCLRDRPTSRSRKLLGLSVANTVLLIIQVCLYAAHASHDWRWASERTIEGTYGFDSNYMTLDSGYDWVWEDEAIERAGTVVVSRDSNGDAVEYGTISMYVAAYV